MKPKLYDLLVRCIEDGVEYGWSRAHKHTDAPDPDTVRAAIVDAIRNELSDWFTFDDMPE